MPEEQKKKLRVGQFTITKINNGWLCRWDSFVPELNSVVPNIEFRLTLEDIFELIREMDPDRPEPKITPATTMPNVKPSAKK